MPTPRNYDYAVLRVVPRVERGEFINAGVIVSCAAAGYLRACTELDVVRLAALDANADVPTLQLMLATIPLICAGGAAAGAIGRLSVRERFHWLVAPRSTSIQTSAVHTGRSADLDAALEHLMQRLVRRVGGAGGVGSAPVHSAPVSAPAAATAVPAAPATRLR